MSTLIGTESFDDRTLDCMIPQCEGCPLRAVGLEAVPHQYPTETVASEQEDGSFEIRSGNPLTSTQLEALQAAVRYQRSGYCNKLEVQIS